MNIVYIVLSAILIQFSSWAQASVCVEFLSTRPAVALARRLVLPDTTRSYLNGFPGYVAGTRKPGSMEDSAETYLVERVARRDWSMIAPWIPDDARSLLDVGGGVGAFGLFLLHMADFQNVTLIEKEMREDQFGNQVNTHRAAVDFYKANGFSDEQLTIRDAFDPRLEDQVSSRQYDLIISLRALGFLFPYETYRSVLLKSLKPGGRLIMDIKKEGSEFSAQLTSDIADRFSEGDSHLEVIEKLRRDFGQVDVILEGHNSVRVVVTRRG